MAKLSAAERSALSPEDFVFPERAPGAGSYPIPDVDHAREALEMVSLHGTDTEQNEVQAAVYKRYKLMGPAG